MRAVLVRVGNFAVNNLAYWRFLEHLVFGQQLAILANIWEQRLNVPKLVYVYCEAFNRRQYEHGQPRPFVNDISASSWTPIGQPMRAALIVDF